MPQLFLVSKSNKKYYINNRSEKITNYSLEDIQKSLKGMQKITSLSLDFRSLVNELTPSRSITDSGIKKLCDGIEQLGGLKTLSLNFEK